MSSVLCFDTSVLTCDDIHDIACVPNCGDWNGHYINTKLVLQTVGTHVIHFNYLGYPKQVQIDTVSAPTGVVVNADLFPSDYEILFRIELPTNGDFFTHPDSGKSWFRMVLKHTTIEKTRDLSIQFPDANLDFCG